MVDTGVVLAGLILAGALIVLTALLSLGRRAVFRRELAAVRAGQYPAWQGYARYRSVARRGAQARGAVLLLLLIVVIAVSFVLPQLSFDTTSFVSIFTTPADVAVLLICFATGLVAAVTLSSIIVAATADAPAYRLLRGGALRTGELVTRRLKIFLVGRFPVLLALDVCAALYGAGVPWEICLALFLAAYIAVNVMVLRAIAPLQRWFYPCVPLEHSRWAALAPRVESWARLAGQAVPHVYVRTGPTEGLGNGAALGGSPGTLYLAEDFLASSEWRQQDALLCWLIVARAPLMRQAARIVALALGLMVSFGAVLVALLVPIGTLTGDIATSFIALLVPIALLFALLIVYSVLARRTNRTARRILQDADRRAAELTGDPWAVMTMLATMDTLSLGAPALGGYSLSPVPQRLAELDAFTRVPGPRAPWAYQPVPSLQPVLAGPYTITVPLGMQAPVLVGTATMGQ